jgi:hypothetical protein
MKSQTSKPRWDGRKRSTKKPGAHQTDSVDPNGPQQNETEIRGNPILPIIRKDKWEKETTLLGGIHESRKRERTNDDDSFMSHRKGPITSTFTVY